MKIFVIVISSLICGWLTGQDQQGSIHVEISTDTVYLGNVIGVKYVMKNLEGNFQPPNFEELSLVGGPNVSSSFSMINGVVSQSASYEYLLRPESSGALDLAAGVVINGDQHFTSDVVQIIVLDNPYGIIQNRRSYQLMSITNFGELIARDSMSREDSLRRKLRHLKSKKI